MESKEPHVKTEERLEENKERIEERPQEIKTRIASQNDQTVSTFDGKTTW